MINEVKNQEENVLETRRSIYISRINETIYQINFEVNEKKKALAAYRKEMDTSNIIFHEKIINLKEQKKAKLTEYKKEMENAKDLPTLIKIWVDILENKSSGLSDFHWYHFVNSQLKFIQHRIEYKPEKSHCYLNLVKRYQELKEMLIEGGGWLSVYKKLMEPLNKP